MQKKYKRLKQALEFRNMKQIELSRLTGISKSLISEYVSGKHFPKDDNIYKICKVLNISEVWLMGLSDNIERMSDEERNEKRKNFYSSNKEVVINSSLNDLKEALDEDIYNLINLTLSLNEESQKELLKRAQELKVLELHKD